MSEALGTYILWLPSWYPCKLAPFNGDFIKRHAEAVSRFSNLWVLYIVHDKNGTVTANVTKEEEKIGSRHETIIYYRTRSTGIPVLDKYRSNKKYQKLYRKEISEHVAQNSKPRIVHVHVGLRAGIIARWVKRRYNIPFVITEHWSGFLKEARENFFHLPFYLRRQWRKVVLDASSVSAVSNHLSASLKAIFSISNCTVIPNVVNADIFFPSDELANAGKKFIHISGLDPLKNADIIIKAFGLVIKNSPSATLNIYGQGKHQFGALVDQLGLALSINFHPEVEQPVLAEAIRQSASLILYSSYETFGCVIIEANACGRPVIVSDIPVFHETVQEGFNGVFAGRYDPAMLAEKMISLADHPSQFKSSRIAEATLSKYGYHVVGKQFYDWYQEILSRVSR